MNRETRKKLLTLIGAGAALALVAAPGAMAQGTSGGSSGTSGSTTGNTSGSGGMSGSSTKDRSGTSGTTGSSGSMSSNPSSSGSTTGSTSSGSSGSTMGSTSSGSTSGSTGSMSSERDQSMRHRGARQGDASRIRRVQEALKSEGHDPGPIDGVMGPKTKEALREYQKQEKLQETGRLDQETLSKLGV